MMSKQVQAEGSEAEAWPLMHALQEKSSLSDTVVTTQIYARNESTARPI